MGVSMYPASTEAMYRVHLSVAEVDVYLDENGTANGGFGVSAGAGFGLGISGDVGTFNLDILADMWGDD